MTFEKKIARCAVAAILALLVGCSATNTPAPEKKVTTTKPQPLILLVVDDKPLGQAVAREWKGRTEEELTVRDVSLAEISSASRVPGDAIIFPSGLIGQLAERGLISPLDPAILEDAEFNHRDIFDHIRLREMRWGTKTLATPLGSPQLLLVYRADLFEKLSLVPPADWAEYQHTVERLSDRSALGDLAPPADQSWKATAEPLADGWRGQLLLARAAAYAMHRDQVSPLFRFDSMSPLIDQPPYLRALEELVAAAKAGGFGDSMRSPSEVFAEVRSGRSGMGLTWATTGLREDSDSDRRVDIRFAPLPGAREAYRFAIKEWEPRGVDEQQHVPLLAISGRMAAVTASATDARRAEGFVVWLAGREVSQQVGPHSSATTLFRASHVPTSGRWTPALPADAGRQYADVLAQTLTLPQAFPGFTLPGRAQYLEALDEAVREAIAGKPASEALGAAAKKWSAISEKLGVDAQRRANARSLGQGER